MIRRCELTETAARLSLQLEVYGIPDGFDATGDDWQVIVRVRDQFTNYRKLVELLPPCPESCDWARSESEPGDGHCLTYEFAHHILKTEAKQLALSTYNAWRAKRRDALATRVKDAAAGS